MLGQLYPEMAIVPVSSSITISPTFGLTSTVLIGSNPLRKGFMLYNNSSNSCYVTYGSTSASSTCSFILASFANYTHQSYCAYVGPLAAIRNAGTGTVVVTEFV